MELHRLTCKSGDSEWALCFFEDDPLTTLGPALIAELARRPSCRVDWIRRSPPKIETLAAIVGRQSVSQRSSNAAQRLVLHYTPARFLQTRILDFLSQLDIEHRIIVIELTSYMAEDAPPVLNFLAAAADTAHRIRMRRERRRRRQQQREEENIGPSIWLVAQDEPNETLCRVASLSTNLILSWKEGEQEPEHVKSLPQPG